MSDVMDEMFGEEPEESNETGLTTQNNTELSLVKEKNNVDIKENIDKLKARYKVVKDDTTKDFDEIRDEIKELKDGNHKLLKQLMTMMEGNVHPATLKSYSDVVASTIKLNELTMKINEQRKDNAENNVYEEMSELEVDDVKETGASETIYNLSPEELFGDMMGKIKDIVGEQINNEKIIAEKENVIEVEIEDGK